VRTRGKCSFKPNTSNERLLFSLLGESVSLDDGTLHNITSPPRGVPFTGSDRRSNTVIVSEAEAGNLTVLIVSEMNFL
jgi:hypothetical protein